MITNYLKFSLRLMRRNPTFSLINITGLAIGTLCCLYILLYVNDHYSYDKHHRDAGRIYRVNSLISMAGEKHPNATTSPPIAPALKNDFPEVEQFTRFTPTVAVNRHLLKYNSNSFYIEHIYFVDSTFFEIFNYSFIYGDPKNALLRPFSAVLRKDIAQRIFGSSDPVGKQIEINNDYGKNTFTVTGVVSEPGKSHVDAEMYVTMNSGGIGEYVLQNNMWAGNNFMYSFVRLRKGVDPRKFEKLLPAFLKKYGGEQLKNIGMDKRLVLQPVQSIHNTTNYEIESHKTVSPAFLNILLTIAILIQLIACINFMNLTTARASKRAKEVGVRKVVGADRKALVKQFMGESFVWSLTGILLAVPSLYFLLPIINRIADADVSHDFFKNPAVWISLLALIVFTTLLSGSYPAFYLSAFRPVKVMKGNFTSHISAAGIRRALVVFQFVLSIVLISCIVVISSQMRFMKNMDLGYDTDQKLVFSFYTKESQDRMNVFENEVKSLPEVSNVSRSNNYPGRFYFNDIVLYPEGGNSTDLTATTFIVTDENFTNVLNIPLVSGRQFRPQDSGRVIINETFVREMGLTPEEIIGKRLLPPPGGPDLKWEVVGVMKDFHANSLRENIKPFTLVYAFRDPSMSKLLVSTNANDYHALAAKLETIWRKYFPEVPFEFGFLDEEVQLQYKQEATLSRIINSFTAMAIIISCLGLFGLAAFNAEQRTREISIRKVLGATGTTIVRLLSKDFLKLVLISYLVAIPIAWWAMSKWLESFAYRVAISWWMFALAGAIALFICLFTVSFQAIRAAIANPVKSLRT